MEKILSTNDADAREQYPYPAGPLTEYEAESRQEMIDHIIENSQGSFDPSDLQEGVSREVPMEETAESIVRGLGGSVVQYLEYREYPSGQNLFDGTGSANSVVDERWATWTLGEKDTPIATVNHTARIQFNEEGSLAEDGITDFVTAQYTGYEGEYSLSMKELAALQYVTDGNEDNS